MVELFDYVPYIVVGIIALIFLAKGIRTIRPTERAVVERLGKLKGFKSSGLTFVIPFIEKLYILNITEQMTDIRSQVIITKDNLNATTSLQIYTKILDDNESLRKAFYNVYNVEAQLVNLAQTTMRNVIGTYDFKEVNSERKKLNDAILTQIADQIKDWGIKAVRVELKEIDPPAEVQRSMSSIIEAANLKTAAIDKATAAETEADGLKRAAIKKAEGEAEALKQRAQGEANAITTVATAEATKITTIATAEAKKIETVNQAIIKNFTGPAVLYKQFDVNKESLANNSKIIFVDKNSPAPMIVINGDGSEGNIVPIPKVETKIDNKYSS